jgi:hypothetical protein
MATLQNIANDNLSLTFEQLKDDEGLVSEIQIKLANLGLYPGGGWLDGDLGETSWKGLKEFCTRVGGVPISSEAVAIEPSIAKKLIETVQIVSILNDRNTAKTILDYLTRFQKAPIVNKNTNGTAFVSRSIDGSPFASLIEKQYLANLLQRPDGTSIISYGAIFTSPNGTVVNFNDYSDRGTKPIIDNTALKFLDVLDIDNACVCIGSFASNSSAIKSRWLGKDADDVAQFYSTTKFIGVLNMVCKINENSPESNLSDCSIGGHRLYDLVKDMVNYKERISSSNELGAMFKRFSTRPELQKWIRDITDNDNVLFLGGYGYPPYIQNPVVKDNRLNTNILRNADLGNISADNAVSAYDLVRLISMLGWNSHLAPSATLPLPPNGEETYDSIIRAMGYDTARYVDIALQTLGLAKVITEPVVISKAGWGDPNGMTYAAFVRFVDRRSNPGKLRTFALSLRCKQGSNKQRDTNLAAATTEIIRRIVTEELV